MTDPRIRAVPVLIDDQLRLRISMRAAISSRYTLEAVVRVALAAARDSSS
jgi:hypothetical protein